QRNTWIVHLTGSISDPALADDSASSGVATDTVRVTLYDDQGAAAGYGNQVATVTGDTWAVDYVLTNRDPSGQYTAAIEATDRVGNRRTFTSQPFYVDAAAPAARLTTSTLTATITSTLTLRGDVSESPVPAAGVERVELAYTPNLPGSPFYNEVPPAGEVLHLPLEDTPDRNGALRFRDVSGQGHDGTCNGKHCPTTGQSGRNGNAVSFDGQDRIRFPSTGPMTATTASVWVYDVPGGIGRDSILVEEGGCFQLALSPLRAPTWGVRINSKYEYVASGEAIPPKTWVHLAGTYDGQTLRLYQNGEFVGSLSDPGNMHSCFVGNVGRYFNGLIDEVRVFDRALSADEIRSLYLGTGPVLHLPLDDPWATDGANLEDTSGWDHNGTLHSGTHDAVNKAVAGVVGPYALAFDGVDDYASVPDGPALDLSKFSVGVWVQPTY
ncbi:MAG: LamG domain-containing protein, partial [Acidobacteria bacterium]|nr:LamG domain-containing protein [Acidobacteriota bacterium]